MVKAVPSYIAHYNGRTWDYSMHCCIDDWDGKIYEQARPQKLILCYYEAQEPIELYSEQYEALVCRRLNNPRITVDFGGMSFPEEELYCIEVLEAAEVTTKPIELFWAIKKVCIACNYSFWTETTDSGHYDEQYMSPLQYYSVKEIIDALKYTDFNYWGVFVNLEHSQYDNDRARYYGYVFFRESEFAELQINNYTCWRDIIEKLRTPEDKPNVWKVLQKCDLYDNYFANEIDEEDKNSLDAIEGYLATETDVCSMTGSDEDPSTIREEGTEEHDQAKVADDLTLKHQEQARALIFGAIKPFLKYLDVDRDTRLEYWQGRKDTKLKNLAQTIKQGHLVDGNNTYFELSSDPLILAGYCSNGCWIQPGGKGRQIYILADKCIDETTRQMLDHICGTLPTVKRNL